MSRLEIFCICDKWKYIGTGINYCNSISFSNLVFFLIMPNFLFVIFCCLFEGLTMSIKRRDILRHVMWVMECITEEFRQQTSKVCKHGQTFTPPQQLLSMTQRQFRLRFFLIVNWLFFISTSKHWKIHVTYHIYQFCTYYWKHRHRAPLLDSTWMGPAYMCTVKRRGSNPWLSTFESDWELRLLQPDNPTNTKHLYSICTTSTLVQHCTNVIHMFYVYWEITSGHQYNFYDK